MISVLSNIINKKKIRLEKQKKAIGINEILKFCKENKNYIDFKEKIMERNNANKISIIAEIKKASPSAGLLIENFNHNEIAKQYVDNGAAFLSVLTEEDYFLGNLDFIKDIKKNHSIPILCKDFFIDTYQIPLAKSYGADCVLIILSAVDPLLAFDLYQAANDLNIASIIEVHSKIEAEESLKFEKSLIGINNRNLNTFAVSLNTTLDLSLILKSHRLPIICESGIKNENDIKFIIKNTGIYNFLIGESLLKSQSISSSMKKIAQISQ